MNDLQAKWIARIAEGWLWQFAVAGRARSRLVVGVVSCLACEGGRVGDGLNVHALALDNTLLAHTPRPYTTPSIKSYPFLTRFCF